MIGSAIGQQRLPLTGLPQALTLPEGKRPQHMRVMVEGGAIRWTCGPAMEPTATDGQLEPVGAVVAPDLFLNPAIPASNQIANFKALAVGGSATLQALFFD